MNKKLWRYLVLVPVLLTAFLAQAVTATDPVALVRDTTDRMLEKLEQERVELEARPGTIFRLIDDIVVPHFDFSRIARYALGRYWPRASETHARPARGSIVWCFSSNTVKIARASW